jgi:hypothetical protein
MRPYLKGKSPSLFMLMNVRQIKSALRWAETNKLQDDRGGRTRRLESGGLAGQAKRARDL